MGRGGEEIAVEIGRRKREMTEGLNGIGMKIDLPLPASLPISLIGWIVPISLLACMMVMRMVLSVIAPATASGSTNPRRRRQHR